MRFLYLRNLKMEMKIMTDMQITQKNEDPKKSIWTIVVALILLILLTTIFYRRMQLNSGMTMGLGVQQIAICLLESNNYKEECNLKDADVQVKKNSVDGWEISGTLSSERQCFAFGNGFTSNYPAPVVASVAKINETVVKGQAASLDIHALDTACNENNAVLKFSIQVPNVVGPESRAIGILNSSPNRPQN